MRRKKHVVGFRLFHTGGLVTASSAASSPSPCPGRPTVSTLRYSEQIHLTALQLHGLFLSALGAVWRGWNVRGRGRETHKKTNSNLSLGTYSPPLGSCHR